ncbi:hypothetical protein E8E14_009581 [Neopestalotiopsis sp. 37M]|nr:hypothetical protein E8E14_009581 [Neopestalotiopsis sp. 37M]
MRNYEQGHILLESPQKAVQMPVPPPKVQLSQTQYKLNDASLSQVSSKSSMARYLKQRQNFEKRAQGLPSKPHNVSKSMRKWDNQWRDASAGGGSKSK